MLLYYVYHSLLGLGSYFIAKNLHSYELSSPNRSMSGGDICKSPSDNINYGFSVTFYLTVLALSGYTFKVIDQVLAMSTGSKVHPECCNADRSTCLISSQYILDSLQSS